MTELRVGKICHEYGYLFVKEEDMKFWWKIEANTFTYWEEIPESLYRELIKFATTNATSDG